VQQGRQAGCEFGLFQGSTKETPRLPRPQDDRCPTRRQLLPDEHADVLRESVTWSRPEMSVGPDNA